jgi:molecular chaperone HscC
MIVGIDLGTTNSACAIWRDGRSELIPNALGDHLTPSAVSLDDQGRVMVGIAARDRRATHPKMTATAFKRLIGTQKKLSLGKREFLAEELSSFVLKSLVADAEAATGEKVTGAVITVPAYFNDRQRKATRRAGELANLPVARLINEPTAAALAFGVHQAADKEPFLVFDLGGGTFDVSIVEMFDNIVEVRATAGDNRLGGEDFNAALVTIAWPELEREGLDSTSRVAIQPLLDEAAERARRALTDAGQAEFAVTLGNTRFSTTIDADSFEVQTQGLIARLRDPVLRSLRDSGIRVEDLSEIVLVGGGTRMPVVRKAITRMFGRFPNSTVHPDHAVALGAAVQAGLLARDAGLTEVRLTDVCPFTLGVDNVERDARGVVYHGIFSPIIDRNTPLPVSRVRHYQTVQDNQRQIEFNIFQGEAREVSANVKIGTIKVPVPARAAGEVHCDVRFTYDASGFLDVDVTVPATGANHNLAIFDTDDVLSPDEVVRKRESLSKLKIHPRDDTVNAAILARGTRCYESFTGERRDLVGQWLLAFEAALDSQDPRTITEARRAMTESLDALEGERYL